MTIPILLLLLAAAGAVRFAGWRRSSLALALLAAVFFFVVGFGLLPGLMLRDLRSGLTPDIPSRWSTRPVIVLLGASTDFDWARHQAVVPIFAFGRLAKTLELYRSCRKAAAHCRVLISGGDVAHHGASEADVYATELESMGIDAADLIREPRSLNTWQNAKFTSALLKTIGSDSVILVTSGFHCRRSRLYFSHFGVDALIVRADYESASLSYMPGAYNFLLADLAIHEYVGIARYYVYQMLGLNESAPAS